MATLTRRPPSPVTSDDVFTGMMRRLFNEPFYAGNMAPSSWIPAMDVAETQDAIVLTAELPGMDQPALRLTIENNVLTISGEKEQEISDEAPATNVYLSERFYGAFQRSFTLPRTVDVERVTAHFDKGILTITLPKLPQAKGRVIEIGKK